MLRFLLPGNGHDLGPLASLNVPFEFFESALIQGKFYSIFSFLFGLGFSIQMMRAAERGGEFGAFFRRRLAALLLIGVVHAFIWLGDILTLYALCGFVLLPFRTRSDRIDPVVGLRIPGGARRRLRGPCARQRARRDERRAAAVRPGGDRPPG